MIEVLKHGNKLKKYKIECQYCGAELSFILSDEKYHTIGYSDNYDDYYYIICPDCNRKIITRQYTIDESFDSRIEI